MPKSLFCTALTKASTGYEDMPKTLSPDGAVAIIVQVLLDGVGYR